VKRSAQLDKVVRQRGAWVPLSLYQRRSKADKDEARAVRRDIHERVRAGSLAGEVYEADDFPPVLNPRLAR